MLHILLDTSIYRADPKRRRAGFQILIALCEERAVTLHIPSIVKREFITHFAAEAESLLEKTTAAVKKLSRASRPAQAQEPVENAVTSLEALKGVYAKHVQDAFDAWLNQVHAEVHDVKGECLSEVLDHYFGGEGAFSEIKKRDDFPDAFIWHIVKDVAAGLDHLLVAVAEVKFRDALSLIPKVEIFESLDSLIESETVQDIYNDTFARTHAGQMLQTFEADAEFMNRGLVDAISPEVFEGRQLQYRGEDARITDISEVANSTFDFAQAHYYGETIFRVPFRAECEATLDYNISKEAFFDLPGNEWKSLQIEDADWNPHYMWVTESRVFTVSGLLAIAVDIAQVLADSPEHELDQQLVKDYSEITVDDIHSIEIYPEGPL